MSLTDPVADMLTRIRNACSAGHRRVDMPVSKLKSELARLLRKYAPLVGLQENYTIYDEEDSGRALRHVLGRLKVDVAQFTPDAIRAAISWAKNRLIGPQQYEPRPGHPPAGDPDGGGPVQRR